MDGDPREVHGHMWDLGAGFNQEGRRRILRFQPVSPAAEVCLLSMRTM